MSMSVTVGQLVKSKSGRDKGRYFLVYAVLPEKSYVLLVDGDKRLIEKPKRKNIGHIQITKKVAQEFTEKIQQGVIPSDSEIKRYLWKLTTD